jgi:TolB protein
MHIHKFFAAFISVLFFSHAGGQTSPGLQHYLKRGEILLQDGGKWKTANPDFDPKDTASASYYGYEFTRGINVTTLHIKTTSYLPKRSEWVTSWDGYYTWDPKKQKVIFQSVNVDGAVASGESEYITETDMSNLITISFPGGKVTKSMNIQRVFADSIYVTHFTEGPTNWIEKGSLGWSRLEQPKGNLTFMSTRDGNFEIYSMDSKGENLRNLSCNTATDYAFAYTPDGKLLYYSNREKNDEIYILSADGRKLVNLTNHPKADRVMTVSPDGKWIAFSSNRNDRSNELYVMDTTGANIRRLTTNDNFEDAPDWSPDGKKIIFSKDVIPSSDTVSKSNGEIFIMDADGSNERRLTNRPGFDGGPHFSPDGSKIVFYGKSAQGYYDIFIMDADGNNIINLTEDAVEDYSPSWSPDGKWIGLTRGDSKNYDVWIIHLETKIKTRLTTNPRRDESPIWQPIKK